MVKKSSKRLPSQSNTLMDKTYLGKITFLGQPFITPRWLKVAVPGVHLSKGPFLQQFLLVCYKEYKTFPDFLCNALFFPFKKHPLL